MNRPATPVMFGIPIDVVTMDDTLELIDDFIRQGRKTGRVHQVATVNVDFVVNALERPDLLDILQRSDLNLADGMPIVWASGQLGGQLPERVAGSDLVPLLAGESATRGWKVHLFGGAPGVADAARDILVERHPGARITADAGPIISHAGDVDDSVFERIADHDPDVLCVALGNPKQERFIALHRDRLKCSVAIGIGGSLDMLTGRARRAPDWVQRVSGEWIYRAVQEPDRLVPRYARDARIFLPKLASYVRTARRFDGCAPLGFEVDGTTLVVLPHGRATMPPTDAVGRIRLELDRVTAVSMADHAMLVALVRQARRLDIPIDASPWQPELLRQFRLLRTESLLAPLTGQHEIRRQRGA